MAFNDFQLLVAQARSEASNPTFKVISPINDPLQTPVRKRRLTQAALPGIFPYVSGLSETDRGYREVLTEETDTCALAGNLAGESCQVHERGFGGHDKRHEEAFGMQAGWC